MSIVQFTSVPGGKLSVTLSPVAVVSLLLVRVTVKPICDPELTLAASAVLVMLTSGGTVGVGVKVAVAVGVGVNVAVAVAVAVAVGVNVAVAVGVKVAVAVAVGVGVGVAAVTSSAPMLGTVALRVSPSKSFVMPRSGLASVLVIGMPVPAAGLVFWICRSAVAAFPFGLRNCGSAEMLFASWPVAVCQSERVG